MLGGQAVDPKAALLKPFKNPLKAAVGQGLVEEGKARKPTTSRAGKTSSKEVAVLGLTAAGEALLRQAADPVVLAVTNRGPVQALRQGLEEDRRQLRAALEEALKPRGKGKGADGEKVHKELEGVKKKVED